MYSSTASEVYTEVKRVERLTLTQSSWHRHRVNNYTLEIIEKNNGKGVPGKYKKDLDISLEYIVLE